MITKTDLAYIAGLLDGEGTISISNQFYMAVRIRNTDKEAMHWLKGIFPLARLYTIMPRQPTHKTSYSLELSGDNASDLLKHLLPFLRIKKRQALLAIHFINERHLRAPRPGHKLHHSVIAKRKQYYIEMKQLNS